jgi:putative membrane protein
VLGLAIALCVLATVLCGLAYGRWRANEIAMRHGRPLPSTTAIPLLAASALGVGAVVALLLLHR